MRKATIIIATILMAIAASGQVKGVDLENVVELENEADLVNHIEKWGYLQEEDVYVFTIRMIPMAVDYKHLLTELDHILEANELDIDKPDEEDDLLPSEINGLRDYNNLSFYVALGQAEIIRSYYLDDEWVIKLICSYDLRALLLFKIQE